MINKAKIEVTLYLKTNLLPNAKSFFNIFFLLMNECKITNCLKSSVSQLYQH